MTKVLFVCLGNICRSPMAEAIFAHKIRKAGFPTEIVADSCGTANYHINSKPDHRTLKVLNDKDITTNHLGRQFNPIDFQKFDYILAMDKDNLNDILKLTKNRDEIEKVHLMRDFDSVKSDKNVPDPYYGNLADFENVYNILDRCIDEFINEKI